MAADREPARRPAATCGAPTFICPGRRAGTGVPGRSPAALRSTPPGSQRARPAAVAAAAPLNARTCAGVGAAGRQPGEDLITSEIVSTFSEGARLSF